jgi:hypothetical protein
MGRGTTTFKKTEVTRILDGVAASKAKGTIEFQLSSGVIRFHMSDATAIKTIDAAAAKPNVWDKVLKNGQAKPALTVVKKVL